MLNAIVCSNNHIAYDLKAILVRMEVDDLEIAENSSLHEMLNAGVEQFDLIFVSSPDLTNAKLLQAIKDTPLSYWIAVWDDQSQVNDKSVELGFSLNLCHPLDDSLLLDFLHQHNYQVEGGRTVAGVAKANSDVIGVWSCLGGVGKTSLIVNLGSKIVAIKKTPCLVAEVRDGSGLSLFNKNQDSWNLSDILYLEKILTRTDLQVLAGENGGFGILSYAEHTYKDLSVRDISKIGEKLRSSIVPFILDGLQGHDITTLAWLRECTKVFVITSSESSMLQYTTQKWRSLASWLPTKPQVYVIVNNVHEDWKTDIRETNLLFDAENTFILPHDYKTVSSLWARRIAWNERDKKARYYDAIEQIAKTI